MADFTVRSDHVDVEQIMRQIRMRIKEKRGVDYTEEEVRELANVKLEKFLNPRAIRSELVEYYRRQRPGGPALSPPPPDNFEFEDHTIYESHRMPLLQRLRRLLNPLLKLFFNPNPMIQALHRQGKMNTYLIQQLHRREELDGLNYEVLNNIVLELTRLSVDVKALKMRIESIAARQDFNERRARAFESLASPASGDVTRAEPPAGDVSAGGDAEDAEARGRRRRRRRGRRRPDADAASRTTSTSTDREAGPPAPDAADHDVPPADLARSGPDDER
jgi:hypothetical protein